MNTAKRTAYPKYKDSGVEWMEDIPVNWKVIAIKHIVSMPITDGPHETPVFYDEGIPFASAEAVWDGRVHLDSKRGFISEDMHQIYSKKYLPKRDDVYVVKSGSTTGRVAIVDFDDVFNVWSPLAAIRCDARKAVPRFIFYALSSEYFQGLVRVSWSFGTQPNIGMGVISNLSVLLPSLSEQRAIASFLDLETARIDRLLEKKEKLIELLKEKRSALISRVVTRGLVPDVRLKDSEAVWLGKMPEHWQSKRVKHVGVIRYGLGEPPGYSEEGVAFVRATDINRGKIIMEAVKKVDPNTVPWQRRPQLMEDEILVVRSGAYTGDSAIVTKEVAGSIAGFDMVLTVKKANPRFMAWVLLSKYMLEGQIHLARMRAAQPHLNAEELGGFLLLLPPVSEQEAIADHLDQETSKIDRLIEKIRNAIDLVKEYRTALISAAVTGKIDVRGYTEEKKEVA